MALEYSTTLSSNVWLDERDVKIPCLFNRTTLLHSLWLNDKFKRYLRVNICKHPICRRAVIIKPSRQKHEKPPMDCSVFAGVHWRFLFMVSYSSIPSISLGVLSNTCRAKANSV